MDQETRALRADIEETRGNLGATAQELSARLAPREQARKLLTDRRDATLARLRDTSSGDLAGAAARVRGVVQANPAAAAAVAAVVLLAARRRRRRR